MKYVPHIIAIGIFSLSTALSETSIRFSEVCPKDSPNSATMKLAESDETLNVLNTPILTDKDIQSAFRFKDDHGWGISLTLTPESSKMFDAMLPSLYQKRLAIIIDGKLVSAPTLLLKHANGRLQITGKFSEADATEIAANLNIQSQSRKAPKIDDKSANF